MTHDGTLYLAYGSNMNAEQMKVRCPAAQFVKTVTLNNLKFIINDKGVATLIPAQNEVIEAVLWNLTSQCEAQLDVFEGVASGEYVKEKIVMHDDTEALIYFSTSTTHGRPYPGYAERILSGAETFNLSTTYQQSLRSYLLSLSES